MVLTLEYLMWNIGLKTLNCFSCFPAHDLGHLGPVSPKLLYCPKYKNKQNKKKHPHTGRIQQCDAFTNWVRPQLMWIMDLEILDSFSCVPAQTTKFPQTKFSRKLLFMFPSPWSWVFGPSFSKITIMPQIPKTTGQIQPCDGVTNWVRPQLMWIIDLEILDSFWCVSQLRLPSFPKLSFHENYFLCFPAHDLGYLCSVSPKLP